MKKLLCIISIVISVVMLCCCQEQPITTEAQPTQSNPETTVIEEKPSDTKDPVVDTKLPTKEPDITETPSVDTILPTETPIVHQHSYNKTASDDVSHWQECECGESGTKSNHEFENNVCKVCSAPKCSIGLEYEPVYSIIDGCYTTDVIGYNVRSVGSCTDTDIIIPATYNGMPVISITNGNGFRDCNNIKSVVIPDSVTYIEVFTFADCTSLEKVTLPSSLKELKYAVFSCCTSLKSIEIPESVEIIDGTFQGCEFLKDVNLPKNLKKIGFASFSNCYLLKDLDFPQGLEIIEESAFSECDLFTKVILPESLTHIGQSAFSGCDSLEYVKLPKSTKSILVAAFSSCDKLKTIDYNGTFADFHDIYKSEYYINYHSPTLLNCTDKKNINLSDYLHILPKKDWNFTDKEHWRICDCGFVTAHTSHTMENNQCTDCKWTPGSNGLLFEETTDGYILLSGHECTDINILIPNTYNGRPVIGIGSSAFEGMDNIVSVSIPESVTFIGSSAFTGCMSLTTINLPESITVIKDNTFGACSSLVNINTPTNLRVIEMFAFSGCSSLKYFETQKLTSIGMFAFKGCALEILEFHGNVIVENNAFSECTSVTDVYFLNGVPTIYAGAFDGCTSLVKVEITSSGLEWFDINTFANCTSLEKFFFGGDKETWIQTLYESGGEDEFGMCWYENTGNFVIEFEDGSIITKAELNAMFEDNGNDDYSGLEFEEVDDGYVLISGHEYNKTTVIIPEFYNDRPVIGIGSSAFEGRSDIISINIPESVTFIGSSAFMGCSSLTTINLPNNITVIKDNTFGACSSLVNINTPESLKVVEMFAFSGCSSLKNFETKNLTSIGMFAFKDCALEILDFNCDVLIEENAFTGCTSIVDIYFLNGVPTIYAGAFDGCTSLEVVQFFSSGIEYFDINTFANCTSLKYLSFGGSKSEWMNTLYNSGGEDEFGMCWYANTGNFTISFDDGSIMTKKELNAMLEEEYDW